MTTTAEVINFEGLDNESDDISAALPNGYGGMHWKSLRALNTQDFSDGDPYKNATHSGHSVATNFSDSKTRVSCDITFTLKTAYLTSIFDPASIKFTAFDGDTVVGHKTFHLGPEIQTFVHFGKHFQHITSFTISAPSDEQMAIDDIRVVFDGDIPSSQSHHDLAAAHPVTTHNAVAHDLHSGADHWMFC